MKGLTEKIIKNWFYFQGRRYRTISPYHI